MMVSGMQAEPNYRDSCKNLLLITIISHTAVLLANADPETTCCTEVTASCLACSAGTTAQQICAFMNVPVSTTRSVPNRDALIFKNYDYDDLKGLHMLHTLLLGTLEYQIPPPNTYYNTYTYTLFFFFFCRVAMPEMSSTR